MKQARAYISSLGMYVPENRVTNDDLSQILDTSDAWIRDRTGIRERRFVEPGQATSDLAFMAAKRCLERAGVSADEVELIIVATVTPDMMFPATACLVQRQLGATGAWGFDLSGACSGFLYALSVGTQFIESGRHRKVLVIGADVMSSIVDPKDRATRVLFGDGAGAVLLEPWEGPSDEANRENASEPAHAEPIGIIDSLMRIDGGGGEYLHMPAGGSRLPPSRETVEQRQHYVKQDGRSVFKFAVKEMADVALKILQRNGYSGSDVGLFVPHQANVRIIKAAADRLKLRDEQVAITIDRYANTTAATIPICLCEYHDAGKLAVGDLVVLASFGSGFTWGSTLMRWGMKS